MRLRSLLFVPADSERKFARARTAGADALILDLEDSVAAANKETARDGLAGWIDMSGLARDWSLWVRVNPFDSGLTEEDLAAVVRPGLDGIVLPKASGGADVTRLSKLLDTLEKKAGMGSAAVKIITVATETPAAMFNLGTYAPAEPRLIGLTWGAEDLAAAIGASTNRGADGDWTQPYQLARSLCLLAAANAGVVAIDTIHADFRDRAGLEISSTQSRRDGFVGRLAIHPDQILPINHAFAPSDAEIAQASRIVAAFAADPGLGAIAIDGKMYDLPHLKLARRLLAAAGLD